MPNIHRNTRATKVAGQLRLIACEIERQDRIGHVPAPILVELEQLASAARQLVQRAPAPRVDPDSDGPFADGAAPRENPYA